ncbi:site-specific DNA-methyltransferase [Rhizobium sp. S-51]|uniref:site-specific DNA-methyltransferase (adenine-specific) n=1 Tax=Rhizobium terricola TaxID=2728849 RepID=A0A7Y0AYD2_9HYPH|nr:site-specific DNA-methyltransferase [Rhizobium terricola]NML75647.1 site-specific DNA-methyltransferase [Rhizobium terricola]
MSSYEDLSREQLIQLLKKRDRTKKLGLVWERDEIEADNAIDANFVAATIIPELSDRPAPWRNMVIEGDNFDALRWLRMTLAGKVKCIYIDPPYNTGNKDWVYNDHYVEKEDRYRHSMWLDFLYQRLRIARDLLSSDGLILVSISDEQRAKLEMLMDEVFPGMRIGTFVWRTKDSSNDADRNLSSVHEHVLAYGNSDFSFLGFELDDAKYRHDDGDGRGKYSLDPITKAHDYTERENTYYPILDPQSGWWYPCNPDSVWRFATKEKVKEGQKLRSQTIEDLISDRRIHFSASDYVIYDTIDDLLSAIDNRVGPVDGNGRQLLRRGLPDLEFWVGKKIGLGRPSKKAYWNEKGATIKPVSSFVLGTKEAKVENFHELVSEKQGKATGIVTELFGKRVFQNPKPVSLLKSLISASVPNDGLILDFFAGSGTTAHAVMELNAEDGGTRRFILVSSTEATSDEPDKNLCQDITAERIRRLNKSEDPKFAELAAEFAYLRCEGIEFEDLDHDLRPAQVWTALEVLHDLPLTHYCAGPWQEHTTDELTLIFADRVNSDLIEHLKEIARERVNAFVYAWAPGQITQQIGQALDVRSVREELIGRFRQ